MRLNKTQNPIANAIVVSDFFCIEKRKWCLEVRLQLERLRPQEENVNCNSRKNKYKNRGENQELQ
jgi:hypothetical protein